MENLIPCCNGHDICYGTCDPNKDQAFCDNHFGSCLHHQCKTKFPDEKSQKFITCNTGAKLMYSAVKNFGNNFYTGCNTDKKGISLSGLAKSFKNVASNIHLPKFGFGKNNG